MFKQFIKQSVYRFKRFQRAGYSAFNSMHRLVTIGRVKAHLCDLELLKAGRSMAVCALAVLPLSVAEADETPPDETLLLTQLQLQEVSVEAERSAFQLDIFRLVTNISAEEINKLPISTVADLLNYLPGIDLRERGATGVQADLSMRAGTQDQVRVLINGADMTDAQTGHYSMDIPIDVSLIEKIEVFNGTSYGLGSFSGAINIVTKQTIDTNKSWKLNGSLAAGEYGYVQPTLAAQFEQGKWLQNISASYNHSSGYMSNTDYDIANAYLQTLTNHFNAQLGVQFKNAGANSFYSLKYPNQFDATRTAFLSAGYNNQWNRWHLDVNAMYRAHFDRFELFRHTGNEDGLYGSAPEWYTADNRHWTHIANLNATASYIYEWSKTSVSLDARNEYINSSNLGVHNRFQLNYALEESVYLNNFNVAVGARGIYNSQFKHDWTIGANIGYEPIKNLHLFLNANRAVRIPTFTDLYYQSATQLANPRLKPEKAVQTELGLNYKTIIPNIITDANLMLYLSAMGFYRWGRDIIDWVKEPDPDIVQWKSMNHTAVDAMGTELILGLEGGTYLQRIELSYSFCNLQKDAGDMLSKYALDYLRHKAALRIEHRIYKGFGASWCFRFEQRNGNFSDAQGIIVDYSPVFLLDGQVYWKNDYLKLSLTCKNMANQKYYDFGGILQPQHWVVGKIEFTL